MQEYKIFCDESNHLDYNPSLGSKVMVLGAISLPASELAPINQAIKDLKRQFNHQKELKWTKLIHLQMEFYDTLLEFFFSSVHLHFQAILVPDKRALEHDRYNQSNPDIFYYKMFYYVLRNLIEPQTAIKIYLDYKDSKCAVRMHELERVLHNQYKGTIQAQCFTVRSHQSQIIQLTDMLIGAIAYKARDDIPHQSPIKNHVVQKIEEWAGFKLEEGTPPWERKFNVFKIALKENA
ncbi:DUF3800 domain-containing protein [Helicobacter baculiformis]|uniref:DUF3800 domain-containing protein n=1 Tax=Helicobacter baculiformis TaxID=427351 RepID=A0ABV7ZJB0_9HELI|nr:DUF3800 domain-containing protein [Helicobacter baculiformis]